MPRSRLSLLKYDYRNSECIIFYTYLKRVFILNFIHINCNTYLVCCCGLGLFISKRNLIRYEMYIFYLLKQPLKFLKKSNLFFCMLDFFRFSSLFLLLILYIYKYE